MSVAVDERRIGVHRNQFFLVYKTRVMGNEIGILLIINSLNFPSRFDARALCRLEFWTRKGIGL